MVKLSSYIELNQKQKSSTEKVLCLPKGELVLTRLIRRGFLFLFLIYSTSAQAGLEASWYSVESLKKEGTFKTSHGIMANGKKFNDSALTCACRIYPLGARIMVTNLKNNKSIIVKVTDRIGKRFAKSRIDLARDVFAEIANLRQGIIPIRVRRLL